MLWHAVVFVIEKASPASKEPAGTSLSGFRVIRAVKGRRQSALDALDSMKGKRLRKRVPLPRPESFHRVAQRIKPGRERQPWRHAFCQLRDHKRVLGKTSGMFDRQLFLYLKSQIVAHFVTSDPVPAVVGTAIIPGGS